MIKTIPNFIRNVDEIISLVEKHSHLFVPRSGKDTHASIIPGVYSRFKTLKSDHMSKELVDAIFRDSDFEDDLKDFYSFIQIQKYDPGDFIAPHRDSYEIQKLHLLTLTSSDTDGLVCEDMQGGLEKIFDRAGQYIDFPYDAVHYVSPVKEKRYSMVIAE